ncbi:MAG: arginine deiminase-related protein [Pseudomonadota bacterium]
MQSQSAMLLNRQVGQMEVDQTSQHRSATLLMCPPDHFDVTYQINPWMDLDGWHDERDLWRQRAMAEWTALKETYERLGHTVLTIAPAHGQPDMVFMANCAAVMNGKALLAHFRHPERQGEEPFYRHYFADLHARGIVKDIAHLPDDMVFEGNGDAVWDPYRQMFWVGYSQRTSAAAAAHVGRVLGVEATPLEMVSERYYHLDVALAPLSGGEVVYLPEAFDADGLADIERRVAPDKRILASADDAADFAINLVNLGQDIVLSGGTSELQDALHAAGYRLHIVPTPAFQMAGGSIYCLTQQLDWKSARQRRAGAVYGRFGRFG